MPRNPGHHSPTTNTNNYMKPFEILQLAIIVTALALLGIAGFVAFHFITKYW